MLASGYSALAEYFSSQVEDAASLPTKVSSPKPKKAKDPSAPKKPPTNFLLFANEMRAKLKEQYPEKTHMELTKELGNLWKSVDHSVPSFSDCFPLVYRSL